MHTEKKKKAKGQKVGKRNKDQFYFAIFFILIQSFISFKF